MVPSGGRPTLAAMGILAGAAGWLATRSLQQDFSAYYTAGAAVARGLDPYVNHLPTASWPWDGVAVYRHSRFLYPPLVAHLFRPLAALPFAWAKLVFTAWSLAALWGGLAIAAPDIVGRGGAGRRPGGAADAGSEGAGSVRGQLSAWLPLVCALWLPVLVALERGQVDPLLLLPLAAAWRWRARPAIAGGLLGTAALFKPTILAVLPLLLVARKPRWAAAVVGTVALLAGANLLVSGGTLTKAYLLEVLPRAASYGEGGPEALLLPEADTAGTSDDQAAGIARGERGGRPYQPEVGTFRRNASLPRLLAGDAGEPSPAVAVVVALLLGGALALGACRSPEAAAWYWGGLVAAVIAAPVSWAMGLVWALPLFGLALVGPPRARPPSTAATPATPAPSAQRTVRGLLIVTFVAGMLGPLFAEAWVLVGLAAVAAAVAATVAPAVKAPATDAEVVATHAAAADRLGP